MVIMSLVQLPIASSVVVVASSWIFLSAVDSVSLGEREGSEAETALTYFLPLRYEAPVNQRLVISELGSRPAAGFVSRARACGAACRPALPSLPLSDVSGVRM